MWVFASCYISFLTIFVLLFMDYGTTCKAKNLEVFLHIITGLSLRQNIMKLCVVYTIADGYSQERPYAVYSEGSKSSSLIFLLNSLLRLQNLSLSRVCLSKLD